MRFFRKFDLTIFLCMITFLIALALIIYELFFYSEEEPTLPIQIFIEPFKSL